MEHPSVTAADVLRAATEAGIAFSLDGDGLSLAADREPPGTLLASIADNKAGIVAMLFQKMVARWRNENPLPASDRSACYHCGRSAPDTPVLADAGHAWLHQTCWAPMNEKRQREALDAVTRILNAAKISP
jgi:hypothetical protein